MVAGYDVNADGVNKDRPALVDPTLFYTSVDNGRQDPRTGVVISTLQLSKTGFFPNRDTPRTARVFDPGGTGKGTLGRNTFFGQGIRF